MGPTYLLKRRGKQTDEPPQKIMRLEHEPNHIEYSDSEYDDDEEVISEETDTDSED